MCLWVRVRVRVRVREGRGKDLPGFIGSGQRGVCEGVWGCEEEDLHGFALSLDRIVP